MTPDFSPERTYTGCGRIDNRSPADLGLADHLGLNGMYMNA